MADGGYAFGEGNPSRDQLVMAIREALEGFDAARRKEEALKRASKTLRETKTEYKNAIENAFQRLTDRNMWFETSAGRPYRVLWRKKQKTTKLTADHIITTMLDMGMDEADVERVYEEAHTKNVKDVEEQVVEVRLEKNGSTKTNAASGQNDPVTQSIFAAINNPTGGGFAAEEPANYAASGGAYVADIDMSAPVDGM